jgi:hypothetical protein
MRTKAVSRPRSDARYPRFRRDPFVRDGVFDHGRASAPRIPAPHISPSTFLTVSASATLWISWLNIPPHAIAVYASWPPSPTGSRNTHYQADATPYLGRTFTGWITSASPGAPKTPPTLRPNFRRRLYHEVGPTKSSEGAKGYNCDSASEGQAMRRGNVFLDDAAVPRPCRNPRSRRQCH